MKIQKLLFEEDGHTHEVVVAYKPVGEDVYNKPLHKGTLQECDEYIKTCLVNKEGDT